MKYANTSDAAVKKATGKSWEEWFKILDKAKAIKMPHKDIVQWLLENHLDQPWWSQMITVGYEQACGLREKNQTSCGFAVSVSKTINLPLSKIYQAWTDKKIAAKWLDLSAIKMTTCNENKSIRGKWIADNSQLTINFYDKGTDKTQLVVQQEKMTNKSNVEKQRTYWKARVVKLIAILDKAA